MFITGNDCKKRWKYIRDSYNRCKRKNKLPTGSSASLKTTKWMLYERLRFLEKIPTERASVATVEAENTEGSESGEETSTTGISEQRRRSEEISGEERSNEEVKRAGISAAGTSGTKRNAERSGVTSNEEASGPGKGTAETSGRKKKKTCQLDSNLHISSLLQHWKERDKQRQEQMKIMAEEEEKADKDGINSFCSHIGTILKKLPPGLRVEAKTKVFNLLAEYELRSINKSSSLSSASYSPHSNENYSISNITHSSASNLSPYSPISSIASPPAQPTDLSIPLLNQVAHDANNHLQLEESTEYDNNYFFTSM